ncbi:hypothetical protein FPV67DRAFT_233631 [Lyophyllum atratum]|nr:hypothetical protein FPV67DRAFT_233631 [Lyophyllum atratum]
MKMTVLRIQYPDDHPNFTSWYSRHILCGPIQMDLDQQLAGGASEPDTYAFLQTMIHATDHSVVYRACLGDELEAVVLKFSVDDDSIADLRREAIAYTSNLKDLQGSVIPSFYGIYHGRCSHGRDVSCIVLQDCGDSIKTEFRELPIEESLENFTWSQSATHATLLSETSWPRTASTASSTFTL